MKFLCMTVVFLSSFSHPSVAAKPCRFIIQKLWEGELNRKEVIAVFKKIESVAGGLGLPEGNVYVDTLAMSPSCYKNQLHIPYLDLIEMNQLFEVLGHEYAHLLLDKNLNPKGNKLLSQYEKFIREWDSGKKKREALKTRIRKHWATRKPEVSLKELLDTKVKPLEEQDHQLLLKQEVLMEENVRAKFIVGCAQELFADLMTCSAGNRGDTVSASLAKMGLEDAAGRNNQDFIPVEGWNEPTDPHLFLAPARTYLWKKYLEPARSPAAKGKVMEKLPRVIELWLKDGDALFPENIDRVEEFKIEEANRLFIRLVDDVMGK